MSKKKVIIILLFAIVIIIAIVLLFMSLINHEETTDEVKRYEVVDDGVSINLKILDEINPPKFKSNMKENISLTSVKKDLSMQYILNIIKDYDKNFDEKDYKFTCYGPNVYLYISLKYHIGEIETTKTYSVTVKDGKVSFITPNVYNKENKDNITDTDKKKLLELASNFKGDYKAKKIYEARKGLFKTDKVLKKDGTIDPNNMKIKVKELEEKFIYDFETNKLWYEAIIIMEESNGELSDGGTIQVALN